MALKKRHGVVFAVLFFLWLLAGEGSAEWAKVRYVVDGDTIILESDQHVRLLGVDTPEIKSEYNPREEYYARQAKQFVEQVIAGKMVFLESEDAQAPFDKYGRRLAYVYLEDQTLLNRELVQQGYGEAIRFFPYKFKGEFLILEKQAQNEKLGMWGESERNGKKW